MDDLDHRLIAELRVNARATVPTLAKLLGVARGTVQTRMDRLIANGVIAGFTVRLKDHDATDRIRGIMMIELEGRNVKGVVASLRKNPGFAALHTTNGLWDLIAEIDVPSMAEFNRLLTGIRIMEGISKSETHLLLGPA
ncbi:Lrp/AsnC family transcriptional regulator [Bosea sp. RAF48]|uniref:Lrp/AsnC family transcriptional regulator n=1 Tax=Bosea sp. RAF48 TaxID=3237480 RepID=UPI003F8E5EB4